jgi:hypothetical protein
MATKKPPVLLYQLRKCMERFMNTGCALSPKSEIIDAYNVGPMKRINAIDRIYFDVDEHLRCGWMIMLGEGFNVKIVFFLNKKSVLYLLKMKRTSSKCIWCMQPRAIRDLSTQTHCSSSTFQ